jgi:hypothetical protein
MFIARTVIRIYIINKPRDPKNPVVFIYDDLLEERRKDDEQTKKLWMENCDPALTMFCWSRTGWAEPRPCCEKTRPCPAGMNDLRV